MEAEKISTKIFDEAGDGFSVNIELVNNIGGFLIKFPEEVGGQQVKVDLFEGKLSAMFWLDNADEDVTKKVTIKESVCHIQ